MRRLAFVIAIAFVLAACSAEAGPAATAETGSTAAPDVTAPPASVEPDATEVAEASAESTPEATPEPSAPVEGPKTFAVGEPIDVTGDFISSDVRVTVEQVKQAKKYGDYSKPSKGNVYLAVKYTYEALDDGATYNPFDWQIFVDGMAVDNFAFVMDGPEPQLSSGTLPKGRKASGWVVYEVPTKGQVILSYGSSVLGGGAPTFEVVARKA